MCAFFFNTFYLLIRNCFRFFFFDRMTAEVEKPLSEKKSPMQEVINSVEDVQPNKVSGS